MVFLELRLADSKGKTLFIRCYIEVVHRRILVTCCERSSSLELAGLTYCDAMKT